MNIAISRVWRALLAASLFTCSGYSLADEPVAKADDVSVESFIKVLDQLQADPTSREEVRKTIQQRIDAIKAPSADIQTTEKALAEAQAKAVDLKQRVDNLAKELDAAKAES